MQRLRCPPGFPGPHDHQAIAALYQRHAPTILTFIRRQVPTREDAEDLLLDVFVAALENEKLRTLEPEKQLAWLRRVAHNKLNDYYRRAHRRPAVPLDETVEMLYDNDLAPEQMALRQEAHAQLRAQLSSLPELQQNILRLRFANGLRCAEIARRVNKSEGAVRTLLSRSLSLLRSIYADEREV
ncbi:MAG: sigma-70 family RNA polymerase sigma factor [Ktedonobacteraceae bacterium]|nr:sigma-70 family RNA polymerase sigma factor [Ktedonobacteraceae bacterium]